MFFKSRFAVVPTFKELICKVQISTFFRIIGSLRRTHAKISWVISILLGNDCIFINFCILF
nr:hypothetical protein [Leptospira noguchii]